MERNFIYRLLIVMAVIISVSVIVLIFSFVISKSDNNFLTYLYNLPYSLKGAVDNIISVIAITIALYNYRVILNFIRRSIKATDKQIISKWYVSRHIKKNNKIDVLTDVWHIRRSISGKYEVYMYNYENDYVKKGELVYNERDRFNILLIGSDHKQQSLVCFQTNIPKKSDTRLLGLGVGDDSQYFLTTRVYLASRVKFPIEYINAVLLDASKSMLYCANETPMVQLPPHLISEVLGRHPIPDLGTQTKEDISFLRKFLRKGNT